MADIEKLKSLVYRLNDLSSLRNLFAALNYEFVDEPANKQDWSETEKSVVTESKIIAKRDDYLIYYIQTTTDALKEWKNVATKIIKNRHGLCLVCSHNPGGFKWVFSGISREFSMSFSETRHIPIEIRPETGVPKSFVEFLAKIQVNGDNTSSVAIKISEAFDNFAVQIHDELTINVFEALKILTEGIINENSNGLELSNEALDRIREPVFILLYRMMFVLYAEDREIFPTEHNEYYNKFSMKWIKHNLLLKPDSQKKLQEYIVEERLKTLFRLIELGSEDFGYNPDEFFMRSYYGRLFDRKIHPELEKWKIPNKQLLDAIGLLTRTRDKKGNYFFLDYAALETRHLGSIYEHLLEYHLTVKDKKISDLPNPEERKNTGSYYTPQYIVDYMIMNTVGPFVDQIIKDTSYPEEQIEKILSLNILDPAMGSGHFLVGVVNYIAKRICEIGGAEITEQRMNECKRDVVRRCVYGVDANPLAVDLAMVSLWLETLSSERPLSFLNAHLKCGNSLIGSEIEALFDKQTTLMESQKGREKFKKTIKDFIMLENLEDDSASAVKTKIEKYENIKSKGTIYYDLRYLLDCKTAESFGINIPAFGDYKAKIGENSLDFFVDETLQKIKKLSSIQQFFHWELEFPDIFYDTDGKKKRNPGFDIIIGNPPYVSLESLSRQNRDLVTILEKNYSDIAKGHWDLFMIFIKRAMELVKSGGYLSFIVPSTFSKEKYGTDLRRFLIENYSLNMLFDFGAENVFKKVARQYNIFVINKTKNEKNETKIMKSVNGKFQESATIDQKEFLNFYNNTFRTDLTIEDINLKEKIFEKAELLGNICCINPGVAAQSGIHSPKKFQKDDVIHESYSKGFKRYIEGKDVSRYKISWNGKYIDYDNNAEYFHRPKFPQLFENNKIIIRVISGEKNRLLVAYDENKFYTNHTCNHLVLWSNEIKQLQNPGKKWKIIEKHDFSLLYLTGILGSKLMSYYFSKFIATGTLQGTYSAINPEELRGFPIKDCSKSQKEKIIYLVKKLLVSESNKHADKKNIENMDSESEVKKIDNEIDELVFEIYGLNQSERFMVNRYFDE